MGMLSKIGLLMRNGADITIRNHAGMLALHNFAGEGGLREVRAVLADYDSSNPPSGASGIQQQKEERDNKWKKVINARDNNGRTPLWMACAHEKGPEMATKMAQWLICRGADPTLGDDCGITPLHVAAVFGNLPLAALLLKHGASLHSVTSRPGGQLFFTPQAAPSSGGELAHQQPQPQPSTQQQPQQLVHVALPAGVSPLHVAKKEGHTELVSYFHELLGP